MFFKKLSERKSKFKNIDVRLSKHFGNRFDRRRVNKIKKYILSRDGLKMLTGQADLVFSKKENLFYLLFFVRNQECFTFSIEKALWDSLSKFKEKDFYLSEQIPSPFFKRSQVIQINVRQKSELLLEEI